MGAVKGIRNLITAGQNSICSFALSFFYIDPRFAAQIPAKYPDTDLSGLSGIQIITSSPI